MVSGVSPFHQPGAGRLTSTVIAPALTGVMGIEPLAPVSSQLPILSAAAAGCGAVTASASAKAPPRAAQSVIRRFIEVSRGKDIVIPERLFLWLFGPVSCCERVSSRPQRERAGDILAQPGSFEPECEIRRLFHRDVGP